jgi:GxxExxY protein
MPADRYPHQELTYSIIGAFFEVYNNLRFGFAEHLYVMALERELRARGHHVGREVGVEVMYKGEALGYQRLDTIVDHAVVVEVKAGFELHKSATRQVYGYLCATRLAVGLLLHFGPEPRVFRVDRNGDTRVKRVPTSTHRPGYSGHSGDGR